MSQLTEFYGDLISLCGIEIGASGRLVVKVADEEGSFQDFPLSYDGFPLVFPEKQYVNAHENKEAKCIVMHPLAESSLRAPSIVQDILRKAAIVRLCNTGNELLEKAVSINYEASMSGIQLTHKLAGLFSQVGESVDAKFNTFFGKLMAATKEDSKRRLFNIYIKQHGSIGKNKYHRICVISSPLYDEIVVGVEGNKLWGVTAPRKRDLETLRILLETLFPELAESGYITGSSANIAPTLMAFMEGVSTVSKRFSKLLTIYGKEAKGIVGGTTSGQDYSSDLDFNKLRNVFPFDDYNVGVGKDSTRESDQNTTAKPNAIAETLSVPKREETKQERNEPVSVQNERRPSRDDNDSPKRPYWDVEDDRYRDNRYRDNRYREDFRDRFRVGGRDDRRRDEDDDYRRDDYRRSSYRRDDRYRDDYRYDDYRRDDRRDSGRYNDRRDDNRSRRPFWDN